MAIDPKSGSQPSERTRNIIYVLIIALAVVVCLGSWARNRQVASRDSHAAGNHARVAAMPKMTDLLLSIIDHTDPMDTLYANDLRAQVTNAQLQQVAPDTIRGMRLRWLHAQELLKSGSMDEALAEYDLFMKIMGAKNPAMAQYVKKDVMTDEALCYMRLGEDQNCCANRSAVACLMPIHGTGIHTKPRGSRGAIAILSRLLTDDPKDLKAKWLLNIAYSTLGEYPGKVPPRWLIPPSVFKSDYDLKHFDNIAPALGLDTNGHAGGVIMEDFDGDGFLDLMISAYSPHGQLRYYHNNGDGTFTDRTKEAGLIGEISSLNIIQTDYNNDGKPDVLVLRGGWLGKAGHIPSSLLRNNGDGTFTDVTIQAGLLSMHPTQTAVWLDYNNDGWLDLFIGNESREADDPNPCELFRNNHDGTFTDVAPECGLDKLAFIKAVISADYNEDGRPDLYVSCQNSANMLFRNDGPAGPDKSWRAPWKFTEVAHQAGVDKQHNTFSCAFFDYDNDGWPDLFVNGYGIKDVSDVAADYLGLPNTGERARLYRNNHDGTFSDVTRAAHLYKVTQGMGMNIGDLDNDGNIDIYVGTGNNDLSTLVPNRMFRNDGGKYFQDVTTAGDFGNIQKGHGIAFGDINNNGTQDIFAVMGGAFAGDVARDSLYKNPGFGNHWITLKLEGVQSNRAAIGARIKIVAATAQGDRAIYKTVGTGGSFGANPLRQEIGLGKATALRSVEIFWPSGRTQTVPGLSMDRFYSVREGDATAVPLALKSFPLPAARDGTPVPAGTDVADRTF